MHVVRRVRAWCGWSAAGLRTLLKPECPDQPGQTAQSSPDSQTDNTSSPSALRGQTPATQPSCDPSRLSSSSKIISQTQLVAKVTRSSWLERVWTDYLSNRRCHEQSSWALQRSLLVKMWCNRHIMKTWPLGVSENKYELGKNPLIRSANYEVQRVMS